MSAGVFVPRLARVALGVTMAWSLAACQLDAKIDTRETERARLDLKNFESALKMYHRKKGTWPTEQEGLAAVQRSGILIELPKDPWGRPYHFAVENGIPVVTTLGRDGRPGGKGPDADLSTQLAPVSARTP
ncbi:MAG: type II secretion system protein GspG [Myxococcaceae bacterium]|nr:type II secretion system protein GspG [Myxococcaceae bacterium]